MTEEDFEFIYKGEIKIQPFAISCGFLPDKDGTRKELTKEYIEQLMGKDLPDDIEYIEADVYFEYFYFKTHKANECDDPVRTNAHGYIDKIEFS